MSSHDVAAALRLAARERAAVPLLIDALERVLYHVSVRPEQRDGWYERRAALQAAEHALSAAGHPWSRQRYTFKRSLENERTN